MVDKKIDTGNIIKPVMLGAVVIGGAVVLSNVFKVTMAAISGVAHDNYGNGVEGVTVTLNGASMVTAADGAYSFETTPGTYTISFSKDGYYPISRIIELSAGTETTFNIPMAETIIDPTGTVLCLPMSEGAGLYVMDVSGNGNDGLLGGGEVGKEPSWVTLPDGKRALSFDGVDDYIEVPDSPTIRDLYTSPFTIEVRAKTGSLPWSPDLQTFIGWVGKIRLILSATLLQWRGFVDGVYLSLAQATVTHDLLRHHWVLVYNGSEYTIFRNGVALPTTSVNRVGDVGTGSLVIGSWAGQAYNGFKDGVRLYSRALTGDEALALSAL